MSLTPDAIARIFIDNYFASLGLRFKPAIELATTDLILPAIEHNLGIGFLPPEFVEEALDTGTVFRIAIPDDMDEFAELLWNSLNEDNKVSLFVRYIDIETGKYESNIINKNK